ncbi:hypothetical protein C8R47DRAFT_1254352 [Mycena vitilis]|nr:hypothetical protein C8R47DRAFT_1254352 [Mycena vitilis]
MGEGVVVFTVGMNRGIDTGKGQVTVHAQYHKVLEKLQETDGPPNEAWKEIVRGVVNGIIICLSHLGLISVAYDRGRELGIISADLWLLPALGVVIPRSILYLEDVHILYLYHDDCFF